MTFFWIVLTSIMSAQITHFIVKKSHWTSVRTSASTSLLFATLMELLNVSQGETLSAVFLGSSFLGMANIEIFTEKDLFFGSWIFALIFQFILPYNIGLGGALGTAAFITCGIIRISRLLAAKFKK